MHWAPPINVFEGAAPRLEAVAVEGCGLPWRSPIFSDLKKLTLSGIEEHAPCIDALLDILTASPQLNEFEIALTHIQLDIYTSPRRVKLPDLRSLRVKYLYPEAMTAVLNSVDAPLSADCVFCIRPEDDQDMAPELEGVSKRLVALARSVRNGSGTLTLQMGYEEQDGWSNWDAGHVDILNHLAGKIQPYTKTSAPKLRLLDIPRTVPEDDDANLLFALHRTFPNVREISLVDLGHDAMVDALRRLFPHPGSGTYPFLSRLTTLTVNRSSHKDWAVWLHSHRRRTGKRGGVTPLPRNLTPLQLEEGSIDTDGLQSLQKLASETLSLCNARLEGEVQRVDEE
ncbi:hypothetical protein M407DRAFT_11846 [Tulasnella calospora MUT 4182]|uniref:Uncharacterized protein n=1 Tax=Tulasnella calospora MUT 4182 TaxID=1051891 RepID=A0A0C3Q5S9_9AGAM|nr:hypothetical protein M407DRAFT_11846 [Tulasnella calospora MUT 4182]